MSEAARELPAAWGGGTGPWRVRPAKPGDAAAVAAAVSELSAELGARPVPTAAMQATLHELLESPSAGAVLVADSAELLVGVLAASWQLAIHVPGRYALIQDLWVDPQWRDRAIGSALVAALFELTRRRGCERVEVGLPRASFGGLPATEAFYRSHGFSAVGPRMRAVPR